LFEAGGYGVGMLGAHGVESAQDDEVEGPGKDLYAGGIFTWHASEVWRSFT
jgi:hypothetical protein